MRAQTCARRKEKRRKHLNRPELILGLPGYIWLGGWFINFINWELPDLTTGATTTTAPPGTATTDMNQLFQKNSPSTQSIQLAWGLWPRVSLLDYNDKFMPITLITVGTQAVPYNVISGKMAVGIGHDYHYRERLLAGWSHLSTWHGPLHPLCLSVPPLGDLNWLEWAWLVMLAIVNLTKVVNSDKFKALCLPCMVTRTKKMSLVHHQTGWWWWGDLTELLGYLMWKYFYSDLGKR